MKRIYFTFGCIYIIYALFILVYFLTQNSLQVSSSYIGTPADPKTFLKPAQIQKAINFSSITNSAYFYNYATEMVDLFFALFNRLFIFFKT